MMKNLFLASSSPTRQLLLTEAGLSFEILTTTCKREPFNSQKNLKQNAQTAVTCKANSVILPHKTPTIAQTIYVITADTLIADVHNEMLHKPVDLKEAKAQLTKLRAGQCTIGTYCIVQKFTWNAKKGWILKKTKGFYVKSTAEFYVAQEAVDEYFAHLPIALKACGSGIMEGYGSQFLKKFNGSYSGALGLPIFEIKEALQDLGWSRL